MMAIVGTAKRLDQNPLASRSTDVNTAYPHRFLKRLIYAHVVEQAMRACVRSTAH